MMPGQDVEAQVDVDTRKNQAGQKRHQRNSMAEIIFSCEIKLLARCGRGAREPLNVKIEEAEIIRSRRISGHRGNQCNGGGSALRRDLAYH